MTKKADSPAVTDSANERMRQRRRRPRVPAHVVSGMPRIEKRWPPMLLSMATLLLLTLSFPPAGAWPLAYIALVPWMVSVCTTTRSPWLYFVSYLLGFLFYAINVQWLFNVTPEGHFALCIWFGLFFPLSAWVVRHMFRRHSSPLAITLPIAWVTFEFLRGQTLVGFPWFYLAHTQYKLPTMIQIADLGGAYAPSFVIAMINGWLTDLLIQPIHVSGRQRPERATRLPVGSIVTLLCTLATVIYGRVQLDETRRKAQSGPRVAILQMDQPNTVMTNAIDEIDPMLALECYFTLARQTSRDKPDLIVMPETTSAYPLNREFLNADDAELENMRHQFWPKWQPEQARYVQRTSRRVAESIMELARETGAAIVIGGQGTSWRTDLIPNRGERHNTAYVYLPGGDSYIGRYDKIHLVLFGEFVPFRYTSWHGLYERLNRMTPWGANGAEYSLSFGENAQNFTVPARSQNGRSYRFSTPICYEDVVAGLIRQFVGNAPNEKRVDFLLNLSNDGWFNHSAELEQHLAACVFRAVEFRVPIARSVNTGISVFIDPTGEIHDRVRVGNAQIAGFDAIRSTLTQISQAAADVSTHAGDPNAPEYVTAVRQLATLVEEQLAMQLAAVSTTAIDSVASTSATSQPTPRPLATEKLGHLSDPLDNEFDYIRVKLREAISRAAMSSSSSDSSSGWMRVAELARTNERSFERWSNKDQCAPGYRVSTLQCDPRQTVYAQWGDWFAYSCVGLSFLMFLDWGVHRIRRPHRRKKKPSTEEAEAAA